MHLAALVIAEMLDRIHNAVVQAINRAVLRVALVEWRLRARLYVQTAYREVVMPSEIPNTNVLAVRLMHPAYRTSCGISEEAIEQWMGLWRCMHAASY